MSGQLFPITGTQTFAAIIHEFAQEPKEKADLIFGCVIMIDRYFKSKTQNAPRWQTLTPAQLTECLDVYQFDRHENVREPLDFLLWILKEKLECNIARLDYDYCRSYPSSQSCW